MIHNNRKTISTLAASTLLVVAATANADGHGKGMNVPFIKTTEFMTGLEKPWDMAFLPDGTMFYTEACKGLSVRTSSGATNALYGAKGSSGYSDSGDDLFCDGQAGVLGVAADWNFAENRTVYLYSASTKYYGDGCKTNFETPIEQILSPTSSTNLSSPINHSVVRVLTTAAAYALAPTDTSG